MSPRAYERSSSPPPRLSLSVSVNALRPLVELLVSQGVDTAAMLLRHGVPRALLDDNDARVPHETMARLWDAAERLTGNPDLALHLVQQRPNGMFGLIDYVVEACATLGDALGKVAEMHRLVSDVTECELVQHDGRARLVLRPKVPGMDPFRQGAEAYLGMWVRRGRELTGVPWNPTAVRFRHARPASVAAHHALFRASLRFGQPADELELQAELLQLPFRTARPELARILERTARETLERQQPPHQFGPTVRQILGSSLRSNTTPLHRLAEAFEVCPRTMQRRLAREGQSLRDIVDQVRFEQAVRYLESSHLSISQICQQLGFESITSFYRACHRWIGSTPAQLRECFERGRSP
jgi:AraC-like DNA-binding protein